MTQETPALGRTGHDPIERIRRSLARRITHATATGVAYIILSSRASGTVHDELREIEGSTGDLSES